MIVSHQVRTRVFKRRLLETHGAQCRNFDYPMSMVGRLGWFTFERAYFSDAIELNGCTLALTLSEWVLLWRKKGECPKRDENRIRQRSSVGPRPNAAKRKMWNPSSAWKSWITRPNADYKNCLFSILIASKQYVFSQGLHFTQAFKVVYHFWFGRDLFFWPGFMSHNAFDYVILQVKHVF